MKNAILLISILLMAHSAVKAQIPNSGFESWTAQNGNVAYDEPQGWATMNVLNQALLGGNSVSVFKSTDKHSGNYASKIRVVALTANPVPNTLPDTIGGVFTGALGYSYNPSIGLVVSINYGFACTARPDSLKFYAKYSPSANDSAGVYIILTKKNGLKRDTVAEGWTIIGGTITSYEMFRTHLNYYQTYAPDSCAIIVSAGGAGVGHKSIPGSELYLDDFSFITNSGNGIEEVKKNNLVSVFPNPAIDKVTFSAKTNEAYQIVIYDIGGKKINSYQLENNTVSINTSGLSQGIYSYHLINKNNQVISANKFEVIR